MRLVEIAPVTAIDWVVNSNTEKRATFTAGAIPYEVIFTRSGTLGDTPKVVWHVVFRQTANQSDRLTGTGNQFQVITNVLNIVNDAIRSHGVESLLITAWQYEASKILLYDRLVSQLVKNYRWRLYERTPFESKIEWLLGVDIDS